MRVYPHVHSDVFLVKNGGTFLVEGNCRRKLLRGQSISSSTQFSSLRHSDTYVLVVCTSSRYLCLPYIDVLVTFVG